MRSWRAGCGGTRTSGSEGGGEETTSRKAEPAPRRRPLHRRHHRYLTTVVDHKTGAIVWCAPGRNSQTLQGFFDELGDHRESIRAVSIDMSGEYQRAFLLREELRLLYHLPDPDLAPEHLNAWLAWASRSKLKPFIRLARTLRTHRDGILAAIRHGLSNGRLEGLNSKIRLISHRAFGYHSPDPLIALVYLCCAGITIELPR
jgi:transposase